MKKKRIITILLVFMLTVSMFLPSLTVGAVTKNTDVLDDLEADEKFNSEEYPVVEGDYSLHVIQIAESENGNIYIYVYKPSGDTTDIVASSVHMSDTGTVVGLRSLDVYLVSENGVFQKYYVKGISRQDGFVRQYLIMSIYRPWNESYGDNTGDAGTIGKGRVYPVETIFTATTLSDGTVSYSAEYTEDSITFVSLCAGTVYYKDTANIFAASGIKSHYYAFSTNKPIDKIISIKLSYDYTRTYRYGSGAYSTNETTKSSKDIELTENDVFKKPSGHFGTYADYEYLRIQSVEDFVKNEGTDITNEESKAAIKNQDWILRFAETTYVNFSSGDILGGTYTYTYDDTEITSIDSISMKYKYDGKIYNVGIIADIVTEDGILDGIVSEVNEEEEPWWQKLVALLSFILLLIVLTNVVFPILKPILKIALNGIWALLCIIFNILLFPLKVLLKEK